ncbi:MAG: alpha/beta fold hydrolase [Panacagrimonas sp.]
MRIEYQWISPERRKAPLLVFLHEGLGSIAMWRDFPRQLCEEGGYRGFVYSRPGYGQSAPRLPGERWSPIFMHTQAHETLPTLLEAAGIDAQRDPVFLFGHSDGGSIALLHAAKFPERVRGAIVLAPHLFVENLSLDSIANVRTVYMETDLRTKLARYHADVDSAFWGWNDVWLDPEFRTWNIEDEVAQIRCPVLAMQGTKDEFGTMQQIRRIAEVRIQGTTDLVELADCGHSPHRDQPERVIAETLRWIARQAGN